MRKIISILSLICFISLSLNGNDNLRYCTEVIRKNKKIIELLNEDTTKYKYYFIAEVHAYKGNSDINSIFLDYLVNYKNVNVILDESGPSFEWIINELCNNSNNFSLKEFGINQRHFKNNNIKLLDNVNNNRVIIKSVDIERDFDVSILILQNIVTSNMEKGVIESEDLICKQFFNRSLSISHIAENSEYYPFIRWLNSNFADYIKKFNLTAYDSTYTQRIIKGLKQFIIYDSIKKINFHKGMQYRESIIIENVNKESNSLSDSSIFFGQFGYKHIVNNANDSIRYVSMGQYLKKRYNVCSIGICYKKSSISSINKSIPQRDRITLLINSKKRYSLVSINRNKTKFKGLVNIYDYVIINNRREDKRVSRYYK